MKLAGEISEILEFLLLELQLVITTIFYTKNVPTKPLPFSYDQAGEKHIAQFIA